MSIDYNKLRGLSEKELAEALYKISVSMGMGEEKARRAMRAAPSVKKMLEGASDAQLARLAQSIGEQNASSILSDVRREGK